MATDNPRLIYYVAQSLDGFIADVDGGVGWLEPFEESQDDFGYGAFYGSVDSLIIGHKTYQQILEASAWPYQGMPTWVVSNTPLEKLPDQTTRYQGDPSGVLTEIRKAGYSRTWLVGGGSLAGLFHEAGLITDYRITIIPIMLGDGIPLLTNVSGRTDLTLKTFQSYSKGVLHLHYIHD